MIQKTKHAHDLLKQPNLLLCAKAEGMTAELHPCTLLQCELRDNNFLAFSRVDPAATSFSQGLNIINTVSVFAHGAPEREKGQRQGASRGLPLSRDCNSVLRA